MTKAKSELSASEMKYLLSCSPAALQEFELSRLNSVANLEKQMKEILRQMVEAASEALLARMLIEHQRASVSPGERQIDQPTRRVRSAQALLGEGEK
jgi:hypothetical protein